MIVYLIYITISDFTGGVDYAKNLFGADESLEISKPFLIFSIRHQLLLQDPLQSSYREILSEPVGVKVNCVQYIIKLYNT